MDVLNGRHALRRTSGLFGKLQVGTGTAIVIGSFHRERRTCTLCGHRTTAISSHSFNTNMGICLNAYHLVMVKPRPRQDKCRQDYRRDKSLEFAPNHMNFKSNQDSFCRQSESSVLMIPSVIQRVPKQSAPLGDVICSLSTVT